MTEYTWFGFGDLDDGQEAHNEFGYTLDITTTLLSHYRQGADAALYWDAIDYLQPGHDAITRWGLLRGPDRDFARRPRYAGFLQILPYLQPGARIVETRNRIAHVESIRTIITIITIVNLRRGYYWNGHN